MRLYIIGLALLTCTGAVQAQGLTEAQRQASSEVFKYFDCGVQESLLYAVQLQNETPENIVIASAEKCKAHYAHAKIALENNFTSSELPGLYATVEDQFMRNVIANVIETRSAVVRAKGSQ